MRAPRAIAVPVVVVAVAVATTGRQARSSRSPSIRSS
jgi:hypothetical protein